MSDANSKCEIEYQLPGSFGIDIFCHYSDINFFCKISLSHSMQVELVLVPFLSMYIDECIEWQVNYGCQKFYIYLVKIQIKHLKLPFSLSSIHDQNTIFIQISHIAKSHTHKSIFGSTQTINQSIQCIYCQFNY